MIDSSSLGDWPGRDQDSPRRHSDEPIGSESHNLRFHSLKKLDGDQPKAIRRFLSLGCFQQGECGAVASSPKALLSRFLATYPNASEAGDPATITIVATASEGQGQSVRVFCNPDGVSCYMNSCCIGLAWTGLILDTTAADWGDSGVFLKLCVQPTFQGAS